MNDLCIRLIFGRVQRSFLGTRWWHVLCIVSCPACARLPARRVGSGDETTLCMSQRTRWTCMNQRTRQYANMYDNEHTVCVCICMTTNTLPVSYVAVKYLWLCILLTNRLRGIQLMYHMYSLAVLQNNIGSNETQKSALKSRNLLEIQKSTLKSNPLWNPEIHFEIQESTLNSRNQLWNPEIHFEVQKSILKSKIHVKSSGFRNLVHRGALERTPQEGACVSNGVPILVMAFVC